jgi:hypothetical protein
MNPADGPSVHGVLLAHHVALLAIPAIVPAVIVVGVVLYIARKDRREERAERELLERAFEPNDPDPPKEAA